MSSAGGAVVVFAKCPIAGASKTRLAPLLGAEGAALLAKAMLSDVLVSLSECSHLTNTLKVLVYAPGTKSGECQMISILQSLNISYIKMDAETESETMAKSNNLDVRDKWVLLPMKSSTPAHSNNHKDKQQQSTTNASKSDLTSSSLGDKLADALERTRSLLTGTIPTTSSSAARKNNTNNGGAVLFLGMDSPELPMAEIVHGLRLSNGDMDNSCTGSKKSEGFNNNGIAHMCPANDGGYGLLSVPKHASSSKIFSSVRWSNSLTAVSQLKALTDCNVTVSLGKLMYDIDEPDDVKNLAERLLQTQDDANNSKCYPESQLDDSLSNLSSGISTIVSTGLCVPNRYPQHTWKALLELNMIKVRDGENLETKIIES